MLKLTNLEFSETLEQDDCASVKGGFSVDKDVDIIIDTDLDTDVDIDVDKDLDVDLNFNNDVDISGDLATITFDTQPCEERTEYECIFVLFPPAIICRVKGVIC